MIDNERDPDANDRYPGQTLNDQSYNMSDNNQKPVDPSSPPQPLQKGEKPGELGDALRSIYQNTVDENIPPEMLDLLNRLS